jgi:hypothetical protein
MKLDSITKIERFMVNSLLASPAIPLGVNILRLADISDEEGVIQMVNSVIVRYISSNIDVIRQAPLDMVRTLTFEVNIASQSYLTQSGHDAAIQLCAGVHETLVNKVPANTGLEVIEPFHLSSESFSGLTDSSHYTYTQRWVLKTQDFYAPIAIDPCVQRGDCTRLFPSKFLLPLEPGDVIFQSKIYVPVLPPPNETIPYSAEYKGVELNDNGDLVYSANPSEIFLLSEELEEGYKLVSTGKFDQSGTFLICNIKDPQGLQVRQYFATEGGRGLLGLNYQLSDLDSPSTLLKVNSYGYVNFPGIKVYLDPTNPTATSLLVAIGTVYPVELGTKLEHNLETFLRVGNTPFGKGWIKEKEFNLLSEEDYLPGLSCEEEDLVEGRITSC